MRTKSIWADMESRVEAEEALGDPAGEIIGTRVQDDEVRYRYVGVTVRGRLLVVAFTMRGEAVRPITAFDADRPTARRYWRGELQ